MLRRPILHPSSIGDGRFPSRNVFLPNFLINAYSSVNAYIPLYKLRLSIPSGLPHLAAAVRRPGRGSRLCTHPQLAAHVNLYLNHLTFQIGNSTLQLPREESAHTAVSSGDLWQPVKCIYLFAEKKRGEVMN